jgi:hypothetical protein
MTPYRCGYNDGYDGRSFYVPFYYSANDFLAYKRGYFDGEDDYYYDCWYY